jgi:hypothetical protein
VGATLLLLDGTGIVAIPVGFTIGQAAKTGLLALALWMRLRAMPTQSDGAGRPD